MKPSKKKRELLAEQDKKRELTNAKRAAFWERMQAYLDNEKNASLNDTAFDEMISHFAKVYSVEGLIVSLRTYPALPQLTRDLFGEWLSLSDKEVRRKEVLNWIHSAQLQEKELKSELGLDKKKSTVKMRTVKVGEADVELYDIPMFFEAPIVCYEQIINSMRIKEALEQQGLTKWPPNLLSELLSPRSFKTGDILKKQ